MLDFQSRSVSYAALKDPVGASFDANWKNIAEHVGTARALPKDIGQFAAPDGHSKQARADFVTLVQARASPVIVVAQCDIKVPHGLTELQRSRAVQMVPARAMHSDAKTNFDKLGAPDAAEMLRLAEMTKPGPFALNTYQLGDFIGLRIDGDLVAMAGQRMGFAGWTEISGVCVHNCFRNHGIGRQLIAAMIRKIDRSGASPFLHTYADNAKAIGLYRSMGFEIRTEMNIAVWGPR